MGLFGCDHSNLSEVKSDGYQYCKKCNTAFPPLPIQCNHNYEILTHGKFKKHILGYVWHKYFYILRCAHCGDIKKVKIV